MAVKITCDACGRAVLDKDKAILNITGKFKPDHDVLALPLVQLNDELSIPFPHDKENVLAGTFGMFKLTLCPEHFTRALMALHPQSPEKIDWR